jgi:hypothetical protein
MSSVNINKIQGGGGVAVAPLETLGALHAQSLQTSAPKPLQVGWTIDNGKVAFNSRHKGSPVHLQGYRTNVYGIYRSDNTNKLHDKDQVILRRVEYAAEQINKFQNLYAKANIYIDSHNRVYIFRPNGANLNTVLSQVRPNDTGGMVLVRPGEKGFINPRS